MSLEQDLEEVGRFRRRLIERKLEKEFKTKRPFKESVKDLLFLLPAYISLIVFVFIPIIFAIMISLFENPTALELRFAFEYYSDATNLSLVTLFDFFFLDTPFRKGIFTIAGLTLLLTTILMIWYIRLLYKRFSSKNRFKNKIIRITVAFVIGLIAAPLSLLIFEWIIKSIVFLTNVWGIALDEYRHILTAPDIDFMRILFNTFFWTLFCTFLHLILGIGLAVLLNRKFKGRGIFRALFILPWAIPSFVSTLMWRAYVFDKDLGLLTMFTNQLGDSFIFSVGNLIGLIIAIVTGYLIVRYTYKFLNNRVRLNPIIKPLTVFGLVIAGFVIILFVNDIVQLFFGQFHDGFMGYRIIDVPNIGSTFWITDDIFILGTKFKMITFSAILINVWLGVPFMMLSFLATLQSIPQDLYEAAEIDGLSGWGQFKKITMPLLKPTLYTVSLLGIIWTFNLFNVVYLLSQNQTGIGDAIYYDIFVTFIYERFSRQEYSQAAALSITVFIILISFSLVYRRLIKAENIWEEER
ncbi:MAG: carbohydrate ABC transporter permease [Candidatus Thorarchaeota archaeon]